MLCLLSQWNLDRVRLSTTLWVFLAVSVLLGPSPPSAQAQDEKTEEQRIEELEAQVQKLLAEQEQDEDKAEKAEKKAAANDQAFTEAAAEQAKEVRA